MERQPFITRQGFCSSTVVLSVDKANLYPGPATSLCGGGQTALLPLHKATRATQVGENLFVNHIAFPINDTELLLSKFSNNVTHVPE